MLHEASAEGAIAGRNAALFPNVRKAKRSGRLATALATIGATPSDAMVVGSDSYADRNAGVVRVYADRDRGVIKGARLFGPGMDHIAHLFGWAIERSETASALLQLPFYHPMFEEGLKTALREICETVGSPELKDMDFVAAPGA